MKKGRYLIENVKEMGSSLKLVSLGFIAGKEIEIIRRSPFGSVFYVAKGSANYTMRQRELQSLELRPL